MEKDRPDRPIVQPVVIARIIEDDKVGGLQGDIRHGSSDHVGVGTAKNEGKKGGATYGAHFFDFGCDYCRYCGY